VARLGGRSRVSGRRRVGPASTSPAGHGRVGSPDRGVGGGIDAIFENGRRRTAPAVARDRTRFRPGQSPSRLVTTARHLQLFREKKRFFSPAEAGILALISEYNNNARGYAVGGEENGADKRHRGCALSFLSCGPVPDRRAGRRRISAVQPHRARRLDRARSCVAIGCIAEGRASAAASWPSAISRCVRRNTGCAQAADAGPESIFLASDRTAPAGRVRGQCLRRSGPPQAPRAQRVARRP